jgi:putative membrane protein
MAVAQDTSAPATTTPSTTAAAGTTAATTTATTTNPASLSAADKKFMIMSAQTDMAELQLSNLALQKSSDEKVKTLAQKLIDDHTKSSTAMKQLAQQKGVTLPDQTDAKHLALATKLQGESGEKFDKQFIAANMADHKKVVKAYEAESSKGTDPDVKGFATQFLPPVQQHTQMIAQDKSSAK